MEHIIIQKATLNHLASIMEIQNEAYKHSSLVEDQSIFASIVIQGYSLVAYVNNRVVGFLLAHQ